MREHLSEVEFLGQVLTLAKLFGWRVAHFRPARTRHGWRTAVMGDGAGFPDLVLLRGRRLLVAELKTDRGKAAPEQLEWLDAFRETGTPAYLWRPSDLDEIQRILAP